MKTPLIALVLTSLTMGVALAEPRERSEAFPPEARQQLREEMRSFDAQRFPKMKELALMELGFQEAQLQKAKQCVTQATTIPALRACQPRGARPHGPERDTRGKPRHDDRPIGD